MQNIKQKRLVILSGPSCTGKGPLIEAIKEYYEIEFASPPVIKSRESRNGVPRPDEIDIWDNPDYFRPEMDIKRLIDDEHYLVGKCREHFQAFCLEQIIQSGQDLLVTDLYHILGRQLKENNYLDGKVDISSVFLSPISKDEILRIKEHGKDFKLRITSTVAQRLAIRSYKQQEDVYSPDVTEETTQRAMDSYDELKSAWMYTHVLILPYGEGHPYWHRTPEGEFVQRPEESVFKIIDAFEEILRTGDTKYAEHWSKYLFEFVIPFKEIGKIPLERLLGDRELQRDIHYSVDRAVRDPHDVDDDRNYNPTPLIELTERNHWSWIGNTFMINDKDHIYFFHEHWPIDDVPEFLRSEDIIPSRIHTYDMSNYEKIQSELRLTKEEMALEIYDSYEGATEDIPFSKPLCRVRITGGKPERYNSRTQRFEQYTDEEYKPSLMQRVIVRLNLR